MKKLSNCLYLSTILLALFFSSANLMHAETHVRSDDFNNGGIWIKEKSPYILDEGVYISNKHTLTIMPGVTIISASSTDVYSDTNTLTFDGANLSIEGTEDDPVIISGLKNIYITHGNLNIKYAVLNDTGIDLWQSTTTISSSTIKDTKNGILARGSNIHLNNIKLLNNDYGIKSNKYSTGPVLMKNSSFYLEEYGIGGIGNALEGVGGINDALEGVADMVLDSEQNVITITDSSIVGNRLYGIYNQAINPISAENNWWGSSTGPRTELFGDGDRIFGPMNTTPWKSIDQEKNICCSNVIFLPGIEASRLYKDNKGYFGTSTDRLWEPQGNSDVKSLFMDNFGISLDKNIYTSDILESAFNLKDIYKSFVAMMNGVVADNTINQWLPFPYDWRMNVNDIVYGQTRLATSSVSLIESIKDLAKSSKTGKVIIIAHSNGGLVAKTLLRALEETSESKIVEKVISIAVPELGTPKTILSMLHGYDQSIGKEFLASEKNVRNLSSNMQSAYNLLPSKKFFQLNPTNTISYSLSSSTQFLASTYEAMKDFLVNNYFSKKTPANTTIPLLLNPSMIENADFVHTTLDNWKSSNTTKLISLIGWGLPTPEGLEYKMDNHCDPNKVYLCNFSYSPIFTDRGDGTVLVDSRSDLVDTSLFFNIKQFNTDMDKKISHANILESSEILDSIKKEISNSNFEKDYGKYITSKEPVSNDRWLTITIFSPVDIDAYDKNGNHTGLLANFDPKLNFDRFENSIPNSFYIEYSDVKLLRLPYGEDYQIFLKGNDTGPVIIETKIEQFNKTIATTTFKEMPVTPLTSGELHIPISIESFATSSYISLDNDGDGITDLINRPDKFLLSSSTDPISDYLTYIESIKKAILALNLSTKEESRLIKRIDIITRKYNIKNGRKIERVHKKISEKFYRKIKLNDKQKRDILNKIEDMISSIE